MVELFVVTCSLSLLSPYFFTINHPTISLPQTHPQHHHIMPTLLFFHTITTTTLYHLLVILLLSFILEQRLFSFTIMLPGRGEEGGASRGHVALPVYLP